MTSKNILITGASTGFGRLTAQLLANQGHHVFASMRDTNGRNAEHATSLAAWAKSEGVRLSILELDVTSDESVKAAADTLLAATGGSIDVIINNAGIYGGGLQESFTVADHQRLFDVNVFGPARVNNAFLPTLRRQGRGLIVQVSSILGRVVIPFGGVYDATKYAVEALSENLAYELKPLGIDVAIVQPGAFPTEIFGKQYQSENQAVYAEYGAVLPYLQGFGEMFKNMVTAADFPNKPVHVAQAVAQLVAAPAGQVPLRTVVDQGFNGAIDPLNDLSAQIQQGILQNLQLGDLLPAVAVASETAVG